MCYALCTKHSHCTDCYCATLYFTLHRERNTGRNDHVQNSAACIIIIIVLVVTTTDSFPPHPRNTRHQHLTRPYSDQVGARTRHAADGVFATAQLATYTRRRNLLARSLQTYVRRVQYIEDDAGQAAFIYLRCMLDAGGRGTPKASTFCWARSFTTV